jgi:hypothetical protein
MKNHLKGSHFEIMEETENVMTALLPNNLQDNDFWKCLNSAETHVQVQDGTTLKGTTVVQNKI